MTNEETKTALLTMLKEDGKVIPYRPRISSLTGTTSAILLQQIYFRYDGSPFYKFKSPCSSPMYKVSDSWCEELGFLPGEFDTALRHIGTKCTKDKSKIELLAECPDIPVPAKTETKKQYMKRLSNALKHLVIYWTDSNHVTYYSFNTELFAKLLIAIYIDKLDFAIHGLNGESQFIFFTENKNTNIDSLPTNVGNTGAGASGAANGNGFSCIVCGKVDKECVSINSPKTRFAGWVCPEHYENPDYRWCADCGQYKLHSYGDEQVMCDDCLVDDNAPTLTVEEADKALFDGDDTIVLPEDEPQAKKLSPHTLMKNALVDAMGWDIKKIPKATWGQVNAASEQLRGADCTPEDVPGLYEETKKESDTGGWKFQNPMAMVTRWPEYSAKQARYEAIPLSPNVGEVEAQPTPPDTPVHEITDEELEAAERKAKARVFGIGLEDAKI